MVLSLSVIRLSVSFCELLYTVIGVVVNCTRWISLKLGIIPVVMLSPRRHFGRDLVVLLCNRAFFGQKSCKIQEFCYFFWQ